MSYTKFVTSDRVLDTRMNQFGDEMLSQIAKYSTYDLYLKSGNLMNTQKPTGAGSLVTFANVTETEQLAFTFNYAIPERLIISTDNKYNLVMPFQGLESNRSYIFRYVYKHEGTTIFDITRNAVSTATGNFTVEFQALNQNAVDIIAEANTTVSLQIYVRTIAGTDTQIALLVNDVNALGRLSRNEATAIISADNVLMPDGITPVSSAIGQKQDKLTMPTETIITSGFATGWSGTITGMINQENQKNLNILLTKDIDITLGVSVIFTLPVGLRPQKAVNQLVNLFGTSSASVANAFANIIINVNGTVELYPVSSTNLVGATRLYNVGFNYY